MRQETSDTLEQRQETVEARHEVIDALQENPDPMTDQELAEATAQDLETVRETLTDLAEDQIVEVSYESNESPSGSLDETDSPPDQMTGRLSAL